MQPTAGCPPLLYQLQTYWQLSILIVQVLYVGILRLSRDSAALSRLGNVDLNISKQPKPEVAGCLMIFQKMSLVRLDC